MGGPAVQAASSPARLVCAPRSLTAGRPGRPVRGRRPSAMASSVGKRGAAPTGITRLKCDHRGRCGASRLNTARGTPWVWRTCGTLCRSLEPERTGEAHRTSTSLDVARRRGPRVPLDPRRPARPRFFFRAMRSLSKTTAYPAPQRNRAIALAWREQLL